MSRGTHSSPLHHERPRSYWYVFAILVPTAYALGAVGFWLYEAEHTGESHTLDALYHAAQLFILHAPALAPPLNWPLESGRWLALGLSVFATAIGAYRIFTGEVGAIRRGFLKEHTVICGRSDIVLDMVRSLRTRKPRRRVLVISTADDTELIEQCRAHRVIVIVGRPSLLLEQARLSRATRLVAVYEQDSVNVEIAARACALSRISRRGTAPPLHCHAQVSGVDLRDSLRRHHLPVQDGRCRVRFVDFFDDAARDVLLMPVPIDHDGVAEADPRQVHLVIVGFGAMGLRVAVRAAQLGHFANRRPLRISVIDREARDREQDLLFRYPAIRQTCELTFHQCSMQSTQGQQLIEGWCAQADTVMSIAVCLDDDALALDVSMRLLPVVSGRSIPVSVRMSRPDGLTSLLMHDVAPPMTTPRVRAFGWLDETSIGRLLEDDTREQMAKIVQVNFVELAKSQGRKAVDEAVRKWDDLVNEDYKESNRQQVDHIAIKLRAVGLEVAEAGDPRLEASFRPDEIELLAEMEHARWMAERLLAGWAFAPEPKSDSKRTNPNLIPWAQLENRIKKYDRDAVAAIPELIRDVRKMKLCRRPSTPGGSAP